ncbi:tetratricopeptide repeat protein [Candidatus Poribacteria bacterium]|nr:tetratricopeptide repeat protein [Candidatus Poribacteria bacterium]
MKSVEQAKKGSFFSFNRWLICTEIVAIIGFVLLAALYTQRGGAEPESPPFSQAETFLAEADASFNKQDLGRAVFLYWQALQALETEKTEGNKADRLHANLRIAEIYSQSSWLKDAKSRLEYASHIQPDHEDVLLLSGKLFRDDGAKEEAAEQFLAVLDRNADNAEAHYLLGVLYQGNKQYKEASTHYRAAIENDPEFIHVPSEKAPIGVLARLQLSRTYNKMLQSYRFLDRELTSEDMAEITRLEAQSINLLEQALQGQPGMQEIVNDLIGLLYVRANALKREAATRPYADALEIYERIVELDPTEVQAWQEMAEIYESYLRDKPKALEMYQKIYELAPHATYLAIIKSLEEDVAAENEELE